MQGAPVTVKTFQQSRGCVIVPAHLADAAAVARLGRVLADLSRLHQRVVVVVQPDAPAREACTALLARHAADVDGITVDRPVGKWPAVGRALSRLAGHDDWVAVFDGDGAFSAADVPALAAPILDGRAAHTIGCRDPRSLSLEAAEQTSPAARIHLEAFFNTLALLRLGVSEGDTYCGFDIQCGLHLFGPSRSRDLDVSTLPFYGGELLAFVDTVRRGHQVAAIDVTVARNPPSAYRMPEIVAALLALPIIATADVQDFARAMTVAPRWYRRWSIDRDRFEVEIRTSVLTRVTG